jgi:serine/threonine protein kinase
MLAPETVLQSRYRIIRQLGQGGMGTVYEAIDERLDTTVALKETFFADERLRKQFEREARLLARMHHPALPRVSDHFSEGDGQFLVMQFIAGDDLCEMMKGKQGPFPIDQVLTWGDQLLDALDYLHTQEPQIIHRDIKPQNLKLTSRGQIILLDFGLAKGQTAGLSVATTSASIFGYTPNYAPLEQIQGLGTDARSDIYALSATLYHLMTAVKPPDALTRAAALVNGQPDPLAPADDVNSAIGPQVASVLARAMSQNREQRYATAASMRAALKGTGEVATLVTKAEAATVILDRPSATLAVAPPKISAPRPRQRGETTVVHSDQAQGKRRIATWAIAAAGVLVLGILGTFYAFQQGNNSTTETSPAGATQPSPVTAESSPEVGTVTLEPAAGSSPEETNAETPAQQIESNTKKKAAKANETLNQPAAGTHVVVPQPPRVTEQSPDSQNPNAVDTAPHVNVPDFPRQGLRRRQLGIGPTTRNLPDGSQVIINPDGSRVLISPNGTRRLLRPGDRVLRRRGR